MLVIGYGNDLRSDDGAGRAVAEAISERDLPRVDVRTLSQLTPELSLEIAEHAMVVFVDADVEATEMRTRPVVPASTANGVMTHHGDPATLLGLTATVGPVPDEAIAISIPAENLDMGSVFSPRTAAAVGHAVDLIVELARR